MTTTQHRPNYRRQFLFQAIFMAVVMFLCMEVLFPYAEEEAVTRASLLKGAVVWTVFGVFSGLVHVGLMRWSERRREREE